MSLYSLMVDGSLTRSRGLRAGSWCSRTSTSKESSSLSSWHLLSQYTSVRVCLCRHGPVQAGVLCWHGVRCIVTCEADALDCIRCGSNQGKRQGSYRPDLPLYAVNSAIPKSLLRVSRGYRNRGRRPTADKKRKHDCAEQLSKKKGNFVYVGPRKDIPRRLRYNPDWQRQACQKLGLRFVSDNGSAPGGPNFPLVYPGGCSMLRRNRCREATFQAVVRHSRAHEIAGTIRSRVVPRRQSQWPRRVPCTE